MKQAHTLNVWKYCRVVDANIMSNILSSLIQPVSPEKWRQYLAFIISTMKKTTLALNLSFWTCHYVLKFCYFVRIGCSIGGGWLIWGPDQMDDKLRWKCIRTGPSTLSGRTNWKEIVSTFSGDIWNFLFVFLAQNTLPHRVKYLYSYRHSPIG